MRRLVVLSVVVLVALSGAAAAIAFWPDTAHNNEALGTGNLHVAAGPPPSFAFTCTGSPASCTPGSQTYQMSFQNSGTIPAAVYLQWATGDTHCAMFDLTVTGGIGSLFSGSLCDLLAAPNGVQVSPQVEPGLSTTVGITVTPLPTSLAWTCPLTVALTATTTWGQWTGTPPGSYGWWENNAPGASFTISLAVVLGDKTFEQSPIRFTYTASTGAFTVTNIGSRPVKIMAISDSASSAGPWTPWTTCANTELPAGTSCSGTRTSYQGSWIQIYYRLANQDYWFTFDP